MCRCINRDKSISVAFSNSEYQCCIVHQIRNTLKYVVDKDKREFANNLKSIYHTPTEKVGYSNLENVVKNRMRNTLMQ